VDREDYVRAPGEGSERPRDAREPCRVVDVRRTVQRHKHVTAGLETVCRPLGAVAGPRLEPELGVAHRVADRVNPDRRDAFRGQVARRLGAMREEQIREPIGQHAVISSGMGQSRDRRPASTWAIEMPSLAAASAQATVELTSPATTTRSGRASRRMRSNAIRTPARLLAVGAGADA
jgi:hypothetical protein